jgi:uncharacterized membrane protein
VLWLFISNMIQIMLMPLIMVGQNLLYRHSEAMAEEDFRINQKAEQGAKVILLYLEHQAAALAQQGELILKILHHLEGPSEQPVDCQPAPKSSAPER